jgi:hypothetical protein
VPKLGKTSTYDGQGINATAEARARHEPAKKGLFSLSELVDLEQRRLRNSLIKRAARQEIPLIPFLIPALPFAGRHTRRAISKVVACTVASRKHDMSLSTPPMPRRYFTIGWAVAAIVATGGWLYFVFETALHFVGELFQ